MRTDFNRNKTTQRKESKVIEFSKSFKVGDKVFATLREAQIHELTALISDCTDGMDKACGLSVDDMAEHLVERADKVVDILTTTASSRPKARKVNGGTRKRTPKTTAPTDAATPSIVPSGKQE